MIQHHSAADRFAVVDVETTGLYNRDRIVEIAVVTTSAEGEIIDEWDTLLNPERDVGPTHIHRVTASMVSVAPTFPEVAAALAMRLDGSVLVAHNLPFDSRMLKNEFQRVGVDFNPGSGLCTLVATGQALEFATRSRGIPLEGAHRALADARATAELLRLLPDGSFDAPLAPAFVACPNLDLQPRTVRRDIAQDSSESMPYIARLADQSHRYGEHAAALAYMDLLDWAISDLVITDHEQAQLVELATEVGLAPDAIADTHRRYLDGLIAASLRDGVVDENEASILERAATELGIEPGYITERVGDRFATQSSCDLQQGIRVCFTGTALYPDGSQLPRNVLELIARDIGLEPVKGVTKKGCDLLVAADPSSQSGMTRKARGYGIPVASVSDFLDASKGAVVAGS